MCRDSIEEKIQSDCILGFWHPICPISLSHPISLYLACIIPFHHKCYKFALRWDLPDHRQQSSIRRHRFLWQRRQLGAPLVRRLQSAGAMACHGETEHRRDLV